MFCCSLFRVVFIFILTNCCRTKWNNIFVWLFACLALGFTIASLYYEGQLFIIFATICALLSVCEIFWVVKWCENAFTNGSTSTVSPEMERSLQKKIDDHGGLMGFLFGLFLVILIVFLFTLPEKK